MECGLSLGRIDCASESWSGNGVTENDLKRVIGCRRGTSQPEEARSLVGEKRGMDGFVQMNDTDMAILLDFWHDRLSHSMVEHMMNKLCYGGV